MLTKYTVYEIAALASLMIATPAAAQEQLTLKMTHEFAPTHWQWTEGMKVFIDAVEKSTNGQVKFEVYHAAQLGRESIPLLQSGVADLGLLVTSYEGAKLPLTSVVELPGQHTTACEGTAQFWDLAQEGGELYENEYKQLGVRPIYVMTTPPFRIVTTTKKIENLDDLHGLKIRGNGAAMDKTVRALGAVPVRITATEAYDALSRGTIDGALWNASGIRTFNLQTILRYDVVGTQLGSGSAQLSISEKVWSGLDDKTKTAIKEAGKLAQDHVCKFLGEEDTDVMGWLVKEYSFVRTELSKDELAKWNELIKPVTEQWASELDANGRPGTKILEAYRAAAQLH